MQQESLATISALRHGTWLDSEKVTRKGLSLWSLATSWTVWLRFSAEAEIKFFSVTSRPDPGSSQPPTKKYHGRSKRATHVAPSKSAIHQFPVRSMMWRLIKHRKSASPFTFTKKPNLYMRFKVCTVVSGLLWLTVQVKILGNPVLHYTMRNLRSVSFPAVLRQA